MSPIDRSASGKAHWRSLDDLADTPEFREFVSREFPLHADEMLTAPSRRDFLKVMGASMAFAGLTACRWPAEEIVPFAKRPEGYVPGNTASYATAWELSGVALGLLVTSYDGRPIKIEGNPSHPFSLGGTDALAQATVLELYDPDRSREPVRSKPGQETVSSWSDFEAWAREHFAALRARGGAELRVLSEASSSPTLEDMRTRFLAAFPKATWQEWEPLDRDAEIDGSRLAFGRPFRTRLHLDKARVVVAIDADLVLGHPAAVRYARDLATARRAEDDSMNRTWVVEPTYTLTGGFADHRVQLRNSEIPAFAARLAAEVILKQGVALPSGAESARPALEGYLRFKATPKLVEMARDLAGARGASVVAVGPGQPAEVHALAHLLNEALENAGTTVEFLPEPGVERESGHRAMRALASDMAAGSVDTLLVLGGNPVYDAPADVEFGKALARVPNAIHLSSYRDETSRASAWHLPRAHYLESWGDARAWDGTISVVQPLIEPLWGGRSAIEVLATAIGGEPSKGYDLVRRAHRSDLGDVGFEARWRRALNDGVVEGSAYAALRPALAAPAWTARLGEIAEAREHDARGFEVVLRRAATVHDGRFANLGWLQELPDPLTKLTWDNAALLGPSTAAKLGVGPGDVVRVKHEGRAIELPAFLLPGQPDGSVAVALGYGRRAAGRVGDGVGVDAYAIRTSGAPWGGACSIEKTGASRDLATTQDHHVIDRIGIEERARRKPILLREIDIREYAADRSAVHEIGPHHEEAPLWREPEYAGHRWAVAVDLNACVGCNACTVACQAENNIPVVGKAEVANGREMHWIRVDRYFSGAPEEPSLAHQPVMCQQCENAPCEQVCPVAATMHDHEGLNVMVYNRCVGTRYCSNNCPYKVRRFNWFNNHKNDALPLTMVYNPEVTVRSRGVMEKCTFCVQRIEAVKIAAKNDGRPIRDGEITTACEQACPTRAIVFGDLSDPGSRVSKAHAHPRAYAMLEELNVKPRVHYLARLKNRGASSDDETEGRA